MRREILFSLIAAVLILINAVGLSIVTMWFPGMMPTLPGTSSNDPAIMYGLSIFGGPWVSCITRFSSPKTEA
jgi:hypothetical protein